jgi:hypothetical protein
MTEKEINLRNLEHSQYGENNERPKIELENLYTTIVKTPKQREYDRLMKIYECAGWNRVNNYTPTEYFKVVGPTTHVWGSDLFEETDNALNYEGIVNITVNDFCEIQGIDDLKQREINKWFRDNKAHRASLGQRLI